MDRRHRTQLNILLDAFQQSGCNDSVFIEYLSGRGSVERLLPENKVALVANGTSPRVELDASIILGDGCKWLPCEMECLLR